VTWKTLAALTFVESRYNPTLTSKKGAMGLLQMMPFTMQAMANKRKLCVDKTTPWRDVVLLDLGCEFAHDVMKQYGYPKGLGIYNVGSDTFFISQQEFIDSVQKYEEKVTLIYQGLTNGNR
jgi:hypothetical protein